MAIRSLYTIITDAINFLKSKRPNIATFVGTVVRDVVIESPAQEFNNIYQELSHTQQVQSVEFATQLSTDELDALAANYGLARLTGTTAAGTVTFQVRNFSVSSSNIIIPIATVVATVGTDTVPLVSFQTTQAGIFQNTQAATYFNPFTGLYELTIPIVATNIGTVGNLSAGTITNLVSPVLGIDSIINTVATTGGKDIESNVDFGTRIQTKLSGNNVGTPNGLINLVRANTNVIDAAIVTPQDPEMIRNQFGGSVDIYIVGQTTDTAVDTRLYTTTGSQEFILFRQPALSITSVTGIAGSAPYTFVPGTDFNFVLDPSTLVNGSIELQNKIIFNIGGTNPDDSTNITITYTYNSLIPTLQAAINLDSNHIITSDILVKEASVAQISITANVTLFPGFVVADSVSSIQTLLTQRINALGLGGNIDRSDIISIIESDPSVDQVDVSTLVLEKNGTPIPGTQQRLQIFKTEYPQAFSITIIT